MQLLEAHTPEELTTFCQLFTRVPHATRLSPESPSMLQADAHWLVIDRTGKESDEPQVYARCSLWWSDVADYPDERLGYIGHYAAQDDGAAEILLARVCAQLAEHGCTMAVGPIDGNTFRHYRFVTGRVMEGSMDDAIGRERVELPPFFLEPINPIAWPEQFIAQGFDALAHYISAVGNLPEADPRLETLAERVAAAQVIVRTVRMESFTEELRRIYRVTVGSFQENFLYQPLAEEEFVAQYGAVQEYIRPELVYVAEAVGSGEPVGFLFAVPDLAQAQRGETIDTLVIKTAAVLPKYGGSGVGGYMVARCQTEAYALGLRRVIHALMIEENLSRKISAHYTRTMRRYTLFARELGEG